METLIHKGSIHIVDDDETVVDSLALLIQVMGGHPILWTSPGHVLRAKGLPADDIFMIDLNMPDMDGLTLLAALRQKGLQNRALLMTGHADEALEREALRVGFSAILHKPFREEDLISALDGALMPDR